MQSGRRITLLASVLVALVSAPGPGHRARAADKLDIDYVQADEFVEKSTIRFYVDILDDDYNVIPGIGGDQIKVFVDGKQVPGQVEVQTFEQAKEWVAVAILMAGHQSYAPPPPALVGEDEPIDVGPNVFKLEKRGFINFVRKLAGNDRVAIYMYNEAGLKTLDTWSEDHGTAADRIEQNAKPPTEKSEILAPPFYSAVKDVLNNKIAQEENLPRRKLLLVMSDGKDKHAGSSRIDKVIKNLEEAARSAQVKVFAVGYTLDMREPLVPLSTLAKGTGGIYREVDNLDDVPTTIENIATELKKQYVVTFTASEDFKGADKPAKIRMEVTTPQGRALEDEYDEPVKIGQKAFEWKALAIWIGVGLGGLLLLFILVKIITGAVRRRRAAAAAAQVVTEEPDYAGPYKGKLACTGGPYVGAEFFLTEDVTTIGALPGNGIVLQASGVSKRHCGVKIDEMRFELADFGSTNGTFVNGNKVTKQFLRDGDEIRVGEVVLRFSLK